MNTALEMDTDAAVKFEICGERLIITSSKGIHEFRLNRGMKYLLTLIYYKGLPVPYGQLERTVDVSPEIYSAKHEIEDLPSGNIHLRADYSVYEMVDLQAVKEIKQRLNQIIAILAEEETWHDYSRKDDLLEEKDSLECYLKEVYLPGGKLRVFATEYSLQRKRIMKAISRALAEIAATDHELAQHLKQSLRMGDLPVYHPEGVAIEVKGYWACVTGKKH